MPNKSIDRTRASDETKLRIAVEQIDAVFRFVTLGVCGAALSAVILSLILLHLHFVDVRTGAAWDCYIVACATSHIALYIAYRRYRPVGRRWLSWATAFSLISFAEGVGWGWAPLGLTAGGGFEMELLVMVVTLSVSSGAISAFGAYLPAFFALFLPATLPYFAFGITSSDPVRRASCLLLLVFIPAMAGLAVIANRSFKQLVRLRIQTEQMAADLQSQKDIAERASLAKSTFLAAASHDLRQPVHALGLLAGALRGTPMTPAGYQLLDQIESSTNAMDGLFTALLDISRLDAGVVDVHRRPFAIAPMLERICRDHLDEASAKDVALVLKPSEISVDSDPVLLERIVRNLISNAVRYTDRGRIVVGCRRQGSMVSIQVWDTGRGIPLDHQEKVFEEYYQLGNAERDRSRGLGLGLAIVRRMTNLLNCKLTLRSKPGRGSCFEIAIPISKRPIQTDAPQPAASFGALARGFVVVIDDESAIQRAMSSLLTGWGHDVIAAGSSNDAMQQLSSRPDRPDLIICDYRLREGENGIRVIERMRSEYNQDIPALLITGDTAPDRLAEARASGLILLHKPVSNSKLRAAIVNLIGSDRNDEDDAVASVI
jgi:two-component system, sensor histidine kinase